MSRGSKATSPTPLLNLFHQVTPWKHTHISIHLSHSTLPLLSFRSPTLGTQVIYYICLYVTVHWCVVCMCIHRHTYIHIHPCMHTSNVRAYVRTYLNPLLRFAWPFLFVRCNGRGDRAANTNSDGGSEDVGGQYRSAWWRGSRKTIVQDVSAAAKLKLYI